MSSMVWKLVAVTSRNVRWKKRKCQTLGLGACKAYIQHLPRLFILILLIRDRCGLKVSDFVTEKGSLESWYWENRFSACIFISMQLHDCVQLNLPPVFLASVTLLIVHSDYYWNWAAEQKLISIVLIFRFCSLRDNSLFFYFIKNKIHKQ